MKHTWAKRAAALLLTAVVLVHGGAVMPASALSPKTLSVTQAQRMALNSSTDITKQKNQILLKQMKYVEAVKGIQAKVKNLTSFRWSPLLSFKFPEKLALTDEYDLNIKPLTLQAEIDTMTHRLDDLEYEITNDVNQAFFDAYLLQETVSFTQQRLDDARTQLEKNKAKLVTGEATQPDVTAAQSEVNRLETSLSGELRQLEQAKQKLSDAIGLDVTTGYTFANPFQTAQIPRDQLESLISYTLEHDQSYYEAKTACSTALLNIESYESLMRSQYGSKMDYIQNYINMAKQGMDVDYAAFMLKYDEMLKALDAPWNGKIRILFFSFTKEWFKGEISGTRYIEDEMYAVYTACMEYSNALQDQQSLEKDLTAQVTDSFESLVSSWNTYEQTQALAEQARQTMEQTAALNQLGKADYTEAAEAQSAYQQAQQDALNALCEYNRLLSDYDRLTCGAVGQYMQGAGMNMDTGTGGDAFAVLDPINEPYYYIYTSVADLTFFIGVSIPEDFEPQADSFEVWYEDTQIGTRTPITQELRHLTIDYGGTSMLTLRFYSGDTYVTECEVDAAVPRAPLDFGTKEVSAEAVVLGTYEVKTTVAGETSLSELTLKLTEPGQIASFALTYGENNVYTTEPQPIDRPFSYLTLLIASLDEVVIEFYDAEGNPVMQGRFDTAAQQILQQQS